MAEPQDLKAQTINGMFWQFMQGIGGQIVTFVVGMILARLLLPEDYGVVALAGMFIGLFGIFADGGLAQAVIQKKDADELDFNTMFVTQLFTSFFIYCLIYIFAPFFAQAFHNEQLTPLIRVISLTMPLGALGGVQSCVLSREMMFKKFFYVGFAGLLSSAAVGIGMAYAGYGAWALVGQKMTATIVGTLVIYFQLDWHPKFQFSKERFKSLFSQGIKYLGTTFVGTITAQVKGYIIGWKYTAADLAYYNRGESVPNLFINNIDSTIQAVLFPALSKIQDDKEAVKRAISRSVRISTFVLMPILFGLAAISDKLIPLLYSNRWDPAIPFMKVLCISLAIGILCNVNLQALKATGHIGLIFKLEFVKKPIMLLMFVFTAMISPLAIAWGMVFFNIFVYFVNSYPNKKNIGYSYRQQLIDVAPNIVFAAIMAIGVYYIGELIQNIYLSLIIQILCGAIFYVGTSWLIKNESLIYVFQEIKNRFKKK